MTSPPELRAGVPQEIAHGVRRMLAGNPGMMTGPGTNGYVLGVHELAVLDPGPMDGAQLDSYLALGNIRWILVTHTHADHSPLAAELAQRTGAELIGCMPPADGRQDLSFKPHRVPRDGERLHLGDSELIAVYTPGHASNCVCYLLESARLLFSGDHILEGVTPVILPPDGDMHAYLDSLDKLLALPFERIAPGHGSVIESGKTWIRALTKHRLAREAKVIARLQAAGAATIAELTPAVYDDVPADRHQWAKFTLQAHLLKLQKDGRVILQTDRWRTAESARGA
jgi:glyoxylase-like metal-dependent hydrolase (beta-lactamase superfamily II)